MASIANGAADMPQVATRASQQRARREHDEAASLLLPLPDVGTEMPGRVVVNDKMILQDVGSLRLVQVYGMTMYAYRLDDRASGLIMASSLSRAGVASRQAVAKALGVNESTLFRTWRRLEEGGVEAVRRGRGRPTGTGKLDGPMESEIRLWCQQGMAVRRMAQKLGVAPGTVSRALKRMGLNTKAEPGSLAWVDDSASAQVQAAAEPAPESNEPSEVATEPPSKPNASGEAAGLSERRSLVAADSPRPAPAHIPDRSLDRCLAVTGRLQEATPTFITAREVPNAGVLLVLPVLAQMGLFAAAAQVYGALKRGYYGLVTIVWTLAAMALLRIKNIEQLRQRSALALGWVLGLDRGPEVKTLRRKLGELGQAQKAHKLMMAMAQRWADHVGEDVLGLLYVDGHVRVYHGKHDISKGYVTQRRLAMPATTDYWVNVRNGTPLLVVTAPMNEGLSKIMPAVVEQVRPFVGKRRVTIVFDRGGYSQELFKWLVEKTVDFITYWKGAKRRYRPGQFSLVKGEMEGQPVEYNLYDGIYRTSSGLRLRVIAVRRDSGRQTLILTTRRDLSALEVAYWMFARWRQENYFKYTKDNFALDALVDYTTEKFDAETLVVNPERKSIERKQRTLRTERNGLRLKLGRLVASAKKPKAEIKGIKAAIGNIDTKCAALSKQLRALPKHVPLGTLSDGGQRVRLARERKMFTDVVKTAAYNAETMLLQMVGSDYTRTEDEGRALLRQALSARGDLVVEGTTLHVVLEPMSAPRQTHAVAALCAKLNAMNPTFPGSNYRLHYAIRDHE